MVQRRLRSGECLLSGLAISLTTRTSGRSYDCPSQVMNAPHKATLSHELIAAAASYEVRLS